MLATDSGTIPGSTSGRIELVAENDNEESRPDFRRDLEQARALLQSGRLLEAERTARQAVEKSENHSEALYVLAVSQRYNKKFDAALQTLTQLKELAPAYGRAWQEEGHVHMTTGNHDAALQAFRQATSLNNSLIASWRTLAKLAAAKGDDDIATQADEQYRRLDALPAELLSVRNMIAEGRLFPAEQLCRAFLKSNRQHVEGMRLLADLGVKSGVLDDAEVILENAVEFEPDNQLARFDYMNVLYRLQKYEKSLEQARILRDGDPDNLDYQIGFANQSVAVGDYDVALAIYDKAIRQRPANADLHLVHGHALKTIGEMDPAIEAYRRTYRARRDFGDAYWSLANLKTYRFTADEVALMIAAESDDHTLLEDRIHLCFALGKHYEDSSAFEEAAAFYKRGNSLKRSQIQYDATKMTRRLRLQQEHCRPALFEANAGGGNPAPDPIFVVGLPRAGSTLLEQILASHSQVDGTLELPNIPALAFRLAGRQRRDEEPKYPGNLGELTPEQLQEFGETYIADTRVHRAGAPYFIDKMPNNFRHIGLIHLILPNAKIIDARRHPMACCFSGYKQLFAKGQEFTNGLDDIGSYYRDYVDLMDHWDRVLPGRILRVQYEDVVADTESEVQRILEHCGLPFEEACIDFYKTERSVRTPSSEQVRQPIYTSGLEQWRNFEPWLDPLKSALGSVLDRYPIPPTENRT